MPRGRPYASWLRQLESCLRDTGMAGLASAYEGAPSQGARGDAAGVCPIPDLMIPNLTWKHTDGRGYHEQTDKISLCF